MYLLLCVWKQRVYNCVTPSFEIPFYFGTNTNFLKLLNYVTFFTNQKQTAYNKTPYLNLNILKSNDKTNDYFK